MTTQPTEGLKPCPFCGGKPYRHEADFDFVGAVAIGCEVCGAVGHYVDVLVEDASEVTEADWSKAAEAWNTRASQEQPHG